MHYDNISLVSYVKYMGNALLHIYHLQCQLLKPRNYFLRFFSVIHLLVRQDISNTISVKLGLVEVFPKLHFVTPYSLEK